MAYKTFHVHMTIKAAREHWDIFGMSKEEVMKQLRQKESEGKKFVKDLGCDNFDEMTGCRGHAE